MSKLSPRSSSSPFRVVADFVPQGDQPQAIEALVEGFLGPHKAAFQVLLGVTGSGKTFTMAHVIARLGRPTLVLSPNKTLAAQLFLELRSFFPDHAVEYFVSYYDYYQPEAYLPATQTYIAKDAQINDQIDQLRHSATRSLLGRRDVILVASVSCIYGLGSPASYGELQLPLSVGQAWGERIDFLKALVERNYRRNDVQLQRGTFRVRGERIEILPPYEGDHFIRVGFCGSEIETLEEIDVLTGKKRQSFSSLTLFPASHYVTSRAVRQRAIETIREELRERLQQLRQEGRLMEAERLSQRTLLDLEMIEELGFCQGIENYSRHFTGQAPGEPPPTLMDYFPPQDWLLVVDESHATLPQLRAMYRGDQARKRTLVEHGFRLPSALDNRPLSFEEWEARLHQTLFVSATPGEGELERTHGEVVEQLIRPTGLLDPEVEVRPAMGQVEDLFQEIQKRVAVGERVLVTVLTKKLAEDLSRAYFERGLKVGYLHSDIETLERIELLKNLRAGKLEVLIGINLLREGLDLPEVSLVAILDADQEGFLRSERSLIQTIGRAARNAHGKALLYADRTTQSIQKAVEETQRRRLIQEAYNQAHGIVPRSISKKPFDLSFLDELASEDWKVAEAEANTEVEMEPEELRKAMAEAVKGLDFERAAQLRDQLSRLEGRKPPRDPGGT